MKGDFGHDLNGETKTVQRVYRWLREAADECPCETQYDALWNARAVSMLVERVEAQRDELLEALRYARRFMPVTCPPDENWKPLEGYFDRRAEIDSLIAKATGEG